ncbi:MAG: hypothetical protein B7Z24_04725, partial [Pseudomonadales bacterium 32-42-5]
MKSRHYFNEHGQLIEIRLFSDEATVSDLHPELRYEDRLIANTNLYLSNKEGNVKELPPKNNSYEQFNHTTEMWEDARTLFQIKEYKWNSIRYQRTQLEFGGFTFEGGMYDSDQISQGRIMGATIAGVDQVWTLADNTTVSLTASQLQQLYAALQAHIASVHERGRI